MFYKYYVNKIDKKNRKLRNDFLDSNVSSEEFWKDTPNISLVEKYGYDFCLMLVKLEEKIITSWNSLIYKFLIK